MIKIKFTMKHSILSIVKKAAMLCFLSLPVYAAPIDKVVMFGDSLSDDGNLYLMNGKIYPMSPPYYKGRFSNGPTWVENFTELLKLKLEPHQTVNDCASKSQYSNCAVAGALVINTEAESMEDISTTPDMLTQVNHYIAQTQNERKDQHLFVLWGGGNDYLRSLLIDQPTSVTTDKVIGALKNEIELLVAYGAKSFLIVDLPNVGKTPLAKDLGKDVADKLNDLSVMHNKKIAGLVEEEKALHPDIKFVLYEASKQFDEIILHPEIYQFKNVKDACYETFVCKNPDEYLFWDELHPTKRVHQILAGLIFASIN